MGYQLWTSPLTGYRRRGTTFSELRLLFEKGFTTSSIFEPLQCCCIGDLIDDVRAELKRLDYDYAGVIDPGANQVIGWIQREYLHEGSLNDYLKPFLPQQLISESTPLIELIKILSSQENVYVVSRNGISGIVTRADLRKPPIRAMLFGLISLLEMHLSYWIQYYYPNNTWEKYLAKSRIFKINQLLKARMARNELISEVDCLQLCDKRDIIIKNKDLINKLGYKTKKSINKTLKKIEYLRNRIAHSQNDITENESWVGLSSDLEQIELILYNSDKFVKKCSEGKDLSPTRLITVI